VAGENVSRNFQYGFQSITGHHIVGIYQQGTIPGREIKRIRAVAVVPRGKLLGILEPSGVCG
jgi:hypothetical protein